MKGEKVSAPKAVKAASTKAAASVTSMSAPTHDEIAKRSYQLYLERGSVDGYASEDWIRAEAELKSH